MKRTIIMLLVVLSVFSLSAKDNAVNVSLAPYVFQTSTSSSAGKGVFANYGMGAEASYRRYLIQGLFLEGQVGWDHFFYSGKEHNNMDDVMFGGVAGYDFRINDRFSTDVHVGVADDLLIYAGKVSNSVTLKTGLGFAYSFTDSLAATLKVDGTFGFAKKDGINYVNYRVVPMIGCRYSF